MENKNESLEYGSVLISKGSIAQLDCDSVVLSIPREQIVRLTLVRGSGAERPVVSTLFGTLLCSLGLFGFRVVFLWLTRGGTLYLDVTWGLLLFIPMGLWLLYLVFKKKFLLLADLGKDKRKLVFDSKTSLEDIRAYIQKAEPLLDITVEDRI